MTDILERFVINDTSYTIEPADDGFVVRRSGCAIGQFLSLNAAREQLHIYAANQLRTEFRSYSEMASKAEQALQRLGSDAFHLGKFLK